MNRRWIAAGVVVTIGALAAIWNWRGRAIAVHGMATVERGPLFGGHIDPAVSTRSIGCGAKAETPEGRDLTVGSRHFYVWGPPSDGTAKPIVLAFHGWGSNGRQFESWFLMEKYVDRDAYVVYPDADGQNWDYTGDADIQFVNAIIAQMATIYCVDTAHVLALGFSYGGRFTNHLGCRSPNLARGIVVAGSQWDKEEMECVSPMPVLVVHRTHDETMPIAGGLNAAERWSKLDGCEGTEPISNGCLASKGCQAGAVTFCEDKHFDPEWPRSWNHTMRESYELLAWRWFEQLR